MNSDPENRPTAVDVLRKFEDWNKCIEGSDDANGIKKEFLEADKIAKELPIVSQKHPNLINAQRISDANKVLLSKPVDLSEVPDGKYH
ncbi:Rho family GTPase Rho1 [Gigaspora margarita]|uniref:Rho family GTPase Rho1 n=1 Tax=Gigaspora margarita TaxID=4874 RepID=A0A8H4AED6_GIGMA|nr:Rho family GTPase Rho1 [Gigaspora margarita]